MSDAPSRPTSRRGRRRRRSRRPSGSSAGPGPGRGPFGGGMVGQKAMHVRPVRQAAGRPDGARPRARRSRSSSLAVASVVAHRDRPADPRPRHRPDLRRADRRRPPGRASPRPRRSPACARSGEDQVADMVAAMDVVPGQGVDFDAVGDVLLLVARRSTSRRRCWRGCQGYLLNDVVQGTVLPDARRRRGQGQPAAAELLRQAAARRAAQPGHQRHRQRQPDPAADDEPAAHLAADRASRVLSMMFWISPLLALVALVVGAALDAA